MALWWKFFFFLSLSFCYIYIFFYLSFVNFGCAMQTADIHSIHTAYILAILSKSQKYCFTSAHSLDFRVLYFIRCFAKRWLCVGVRFLLFFFLSLVSFHFVSSRLFCSLFLYNSGTCHSSYIRLCEISFSFSYRVPAVLKIVQFLTTSMSAHWKKNSAHIFEKQNR